MFTKNESATEKSLKIMSDYSEEKSARISTGVSSTEPLQRDITGTNGEESLLLSNKSGLVPHNGITHRKRLPLPIQSMAHGQLILPNIQVELARHKIMGELSRYLLSECKNLRMPSFERWVMDSKVKERFKHERLVEENRQRHERQLGEENHSLHYGTSNSSWKSRMKRKNPSLDDSSQLHVTSTGENPINRYDHVIPSMPDAVNDEASQRLLREMDETDLKVKQVDGDKRKQMVVKELCRRACEASRQIQSLSSRLGGGVEAKKYYVSIRGGGSGSEKRKKNMKAKSQHSLGRIVLEVGTSELDQGDINQVGGKEKPTSGTDGVIKKTQATYSLSYSRKTKTSYDAADKNRKMKPFNVKINAAHYEKLRDMFHSIHNNKDEQDSVSGLSIPKIYVPPMVERCKSSDYTPATNIFHHLVFCVLVRYASLSGGQQLLDLRGGGMQGAIHSQVFDFLSKNLKSSSIESLDHCNIMECFASPLNVYSSHFCSVFHEDLDCHFGSYGNSPPVPMGFFGTIGQVHEANPPFAPGMMELMVKRMEEHLQFSDSLANNSKSDDGHNEGKLTFIVIVPSCESKELNVNGNKITKFAKQSFLSMLRSPYFAKHIILKAREHGYVEASQHMRPTRYKESQYNGICYQTGR